MRTQQPREQCMSLGFLVAIRLQSRSQRGMWNTTHFTLSPSNLHNTACRGHRQGVIPIVFFAIPKSKYSFFGSVFYTTNRNQVIASMTMILSSASLSVNYFTHQSQQSFHRSRLQWRSQLFTVALMGIFAASSMILVLSSRITLNRWCLWGLFKAGVPVHVIYTQRCFINDL